MLMCFCLQVRMRSDCSINSLSAFWIVYWKIWGCYKILYSHDNVSYDGQKNLQILFGLQFNNLRLQFQVVKFFFPIWLWWPIKSENSIPLKKLHLKLNLFKFPTPWTYLNLIWVVLNPFQELHRSLSSWVSVGCYSHTSLNGRLTLIFLTIYKWFFMKLLHYFCAVGGCDQEVHLKNINLSQTLFFSMFDVEVKVYDAPGTFGIRFSKLEVETLTIGEKLWVLKCYLHFQ